MTQEAYVSFEIAKLLKDKGFDEPCEYFYRFDDSSQKFKGSHFYKNSDLDGKFYNAPTHQMACAWIREKGYHIYTFKSVVDSSWVYEVQSLNEDWTFSLGGFSSHDEAMEEGIKYALENLI